MSDAVDTKDYALSRNNSTVQTHQTPDGVRVVINCYCHNGHNLLDPTYQFNDFDGLTVQLKTEKQTGLLALSPVIGDMDRTFIDFDGTEGELVEINCPTCAEQLPEYDKCSCGAYLVAMFTTPDNNFANCIGICPRIGCLHSKIITNFNLRKLSRNGYF
jgi:hypothetical protein